MIDLPIDPPLGLRLGLRRRTTTVEVPLGGLLCFYTDGLSTHTAHAEVTVMVRLEYESHEVFVTIRDHGKWRPQRGQGRGYGTRLIQRCSDEVQFDRGQASTVVRVRRRLTGQGPR